MSSRGLKEVYLKDSLRGCPLDIAVLLELFVKLPMLLMRFALPFHVCLHPIFHTSRLK